MRGFLVVTVIARRQRHAGFFHQLFGFRLRTHGTDRLGGRADKDDAGINAGVAEVFVLRQKTITGMNRFRTGEVCGGNNLVDGEIRFFRRGRANQHRLIRHAHMTCIGIGFRVHRDGLDTKTTGGLDNAAGDLATIGNEYFFKHPRRYILNTPNFVDAIGALSAAERLRPRMRRVCAGSTTPSSHNRADAK